MQDIQKQNETVVMLPCEPKDFSNFISQLLGKPQSIESYFRENFEVNKNDLINLYHLVNQRIEQQNESSLIQFIVKINYSNDTNVTLNSISDFEHYNEIENIEACDIHLTWIYLIKFKNNPFPEKQEINVLFSSNSSSNLYFSLNSLIRIRINHTERTWGIDIESLLKNAIKKYLVEKNKFESFLTKNHEKISLIFTILFLSNILSIFWIKYIEYRENSLTKIFDDSKNMNPNSLELISGKIDHILKYIIGSVDSNLTIITIIILFATMFCSILLAILISKFSNIRFRSFILITEKSEQKMSKYLKDKRNQLIYFVVTIISGIITGILANFIFGKIIESI
ncbi:hypothetical protein L5F07_04115 [Aliarcobacter butzleri]|uniref:hypothetical protein n=1 Tax=Aliarcobacter butzleri TaxID=28197 RepID=UPI001EDA9378|nr:hypothetical protein [Aliarcobacter butzleri]MCG3678438.1 hypothetical protein [Aliarcobacter butzleri]